jgi:DNA-binding NtrC family response regulator
MGKDRTAVGARGHEGLDLLIGESESFLAMLQRVERIAGADATVLIQGETGTGKELVGRAIHYLSRRKDGPFVPVNCGAIPTTLVESELFGCARGAFTDARDGRDGVVAQAERGTLLLDEVEAMGPQAQVAMLRFLQEREYRPVGGVTRHSDVRVIAASNVDLSALAARGEYRRDLLFRLNVVVIEVPALRERGDDVLLVARAFLDRLNRESSARPKRFHPATLRYLRGHPWPGNVRELENYIHREFLLGEGDEIRPPGVGAAPPPRGVPAAPGATFREAKARAIAEFERSYLEELLARTEGNVALAARLSGKERSSFARLIRKHGLYADRYRSSRASAG